MPATSELRRIRAPREQRSSPDSDSRKYRYFEPKGQRATHYEDMTVDVQPDPERYLIQNWIISFPDGTAPTARTGPPPRARTGTYSAPPTRSGSAPTTSASRRSRPWCRASSRTAASPARRSRFDKAWVKILQNHLGAWKHAEFGLGTSLMQAQRYGYTQMINNATLTNSSYKLRLAQDITLYLAEIGLDIPGFDVPPARSTGSRTDLAGHAQGGRDDHGLDRLSRAILRHQHRVRAAGRRAVPLRLPDAGGWRRRTTSSPRRWSRPPRPITSAISPTPSTCSTSLAPTELTGRKTALFTSWLAKHAALALEAANRLQPIWSQPRVKVATFDDALGACEEPHQGYRDRTWPAGSS